MLMLHSLLVELKAEFAGSEQGKERSVWFLSAVPRPGIEAWSR